MNKKFLKTVFLASCIISLEGCSFIAHSEQLMLLKGLGDNQREIERYVKNKEEFFYKLRDDVKNNQLKKGVSKDKILAEYGDPVLCENVKTHAQIKESCLYRNPTEYFNTDIIYLYFDEKERLYSWEFVPASENL